MAEVNAKELLRAVVIFKELDDEELNSIAEVCKSEEFVSGEYIFREGESGNRLYLVVEGEVRISRNVPGSGEEALAVLKPGALFGEMAVFDRSELAYKVLWSCVRLLSVRLRSTNDSLRSFLAMSMF
jgi:CRP/FNR family cyclic AMP-dependent transcriptional regulator